MTALVAALGVAAFAVAFALLRIPAWAGESLAVAGRAHAALRDPALDDTARERAAQTAARRLFYVSGVIVVRTAVALAVAAAPLVLADGFGVVPAATVVGFLMRLDVILIAGVALVAVWWLQRRVLPAWR